MDSIVAVPDAPVGEVEKRAGTAAVSASAISAPPCISPPAVQRSGDHASVPRTSSGRRLDQLDADQRRERHQLAELGWGGLIGHAPPVAGGARLDHRFD